MFETTVSALRQTIRKEIEPFSIYVCRDGDTTFYVGETDRHITVRLREHCNRPTLFGKLIGINAPASRDWRMTLYTVAECEQFIQQKSLFGEYSRRQAEQALIDRLRPIVNIAGNRHPSALPDGYKGRSILREEAVEYLTDTDRDPLMRLVRLGWTLIGDDDVTLWVSPDGETMTHEDALLRLKGGEDLSVCGR